MAVESCCFWSGMVVVTSWLMSGAEVQACWLGSGMVVVEGTTMKYYWLGSWIVEASLLKSLVESCWFGPGVDPKWPDLSCCSSYVEMVLTSVITKLFFHWISNLALKELVCGSWMISVWSAFQMLLIQMPKNCLLQGLVNLYYMILKPLFLLGVSSSRL